MPWWTRLLSAALATAEFTQGALSIDLCMERGLHASRMLQALPSTLGRTLHRFCRAEELMGSKKSAILSPVPNTIVRSTQRA